jgi:hypothetical protein
MRDKVSMTSDEMKNGIVFEASEGNLYLIGGLIIELCYPAMGGGMSEILCGLVAGFYEATIHNKCVDLALASLCIAGRSVRECFACLGHVDDCLATSKCFCAQCCFCFLQWLLPACIGYELKAAGRSFRMLHCSLLFAEGRISAFPRNPNVRYALALDASQVHATGRPVVGNVRWTHRQLQGYARQRIASSRQVIRGQSDGEVRSLVTADRLLCLELERLGYPLKEIYQIWRALPPNRCDRAARVVRSELQILAKHPADLAQVRCALGEQILSSD